MNKFRTIALLSFILATAAFAASPDRTKTGRVHYQVVTAADKALLYDVTRITHLRGRSTEMTYLVADRLANRRYILSSRRNFEAQTHIFEIRDVTNAGKPHVLRSVIKLPLQPDSESGTHSQLAALAKSKNLHEIEAAVPISLEVSSRKDHAVTARADAWQNPSASKAQRDNVKNALDPAFLARIDKLQRELFQLPQFIEFCAELGRYVANEECRPNPSLAVALTGNTCDSDAKFGYPCSK